MTFPYSQNTHEGKRLESFRECAPIRQAENLQRSWVYDYAHSVNNFVNATLALTQELEKFWITYAQVSPFIKNQISSTDMYGESLELPVEISFSEKEMIMEYIQAYIQNILYAQDTLEWVKADEKDFSRDLKKALYQTVGVELSFFPENWENDEKLMQRKNALQSVIDVNPEWWNIWKYKIEITQKGIEFLDSRFILDINDLTHTHTWKETQSIPGNKVLPNNDIFWKLRDFVLSAGEENKSQLLTFLGLKDEKYWTSSSAGYLLGGMSYHYNMQDWVFSYSPQSNRYPICLVTKI